ncbi:FAD:protein FMN transferase [Lactococcus fujiensis]|uniref:FAD:protein FMN transferase n=1 Tax=Lactococcus fujiensis JCM 16395 TaxID=1291764 RepID=A0A2A5RN00_9LACT|nr:FAD:protein FMN transferase [Lactococcus fujiensis]PCS00716.1 membrane-associated lipoprotein for thiamine biosynthesis [Lactococcus fujiensis JCM 16395]
MVEIKDLARHQVAKTYEAMGTSIKLAVFGWSDEKILDEAFKLIQYYEDIFTVNRADSEIIDVNKAAGRMPIQVSEPVYHLSKIAIKESLEKFGFNVTLGPLVNLWRIGFSDARLPHPDEIAEKMEVIDPEFVQFDDQNQTIFLTKEGMSLDLGGIAKGYIADRIKNLWQAYGVESGIINLGGNLLLMGDAPHHNDKKWRIGVRNPLEKNKKNVLQVLTGAKSFVTSGISERHLDVGDRSYHHIIDSKTGYPHDNDIASVTVITDKSIVGEIESTRLFFADEAPQNYQYPAIIIFKDRTVKLVNLDEKNVHITDSEYKLIP